MSYPPSRDWSVKQYRSSRRRLHHALALYIGAHEARLDPAEIERRRDLSGTFLRLLGSVDLDKIRPPEIIAMFDRRAKEGADDRALLAEWRLLGDVVTWAINTRLIAYNPLRWMTLDSERPFRLSATYMDLFTTSPPPRKGMPRVPRSHLGV